LIDFVCLTFFSSEKIGKSKNQRRNEKKREERETNKINQVVVLEVRLRRNDGTPVAVTDYGGKQG